MSPARSFHQLIREWFKFLPQLIASWPAQHIREGISEQRKLIELRINLGQIQRRLLWDKKNYLAGRQSLSFHLHCRHRNGLIWRRIHLCLNSVLSPAFYPEEVEEKKTVCCCDNPFRSITLERDAPPYVVIILRDSNMKGAKRGTATMQTGWWVEPPALNDSHPIIGTLIQFRSFPLLGCV